MSERLMHKISTYIPLHHADILRKIAKTRQISMNRLLAFLIDNEIQKENQFKMDLSLPNHFIRDAFAAEASKIMDFLAKNYEKGVGLDMLTLFRFKIGIPDKEIFLAAFKECIDSGKLEMIKPIPKAGAPLYHPDYIHYRLLGERKKSQKVKQFERYQRLKKKFEKESEDA